MIFTKRVYEPPAKADGKRFLVDRLWPRGVKKELLQLEAWLKEVAPSDSLRSWFHHDPAKWNEFQCRFRAELADRPESWRPLLEAARTGDVTLLFSARDAAHNNAIVLKDWLNQKMPRSRNTTPLSKRRNRVQVKGR